MNEGNDIGKIVLLAAGRSSRLGRPKQLLPYAGTTLIEHAMHQALSSGVGEVIVVLGANNELIRAQIDPSKCTLIDNPSWEEGMASSLRTAIEHLWKEKEQPQGILFMVCDQPYIDSSLLRNLWIQLIGGKEKMVACRYEGRLGTPAAFHFSLMRDLYALQGDIGAGKYLNEHKNDVYEIPFPEGKRDIDTEEEYKALLHGAAIDR